MPRNSIPQTYKDAIDALFPEWNQADRAARVQFLQDVYEDLEELENRKLTDEEKEALKKYARNKQEKKAERKEFDPKSSYIWRSVVVTHGKEELMHRMAILTGVAKPDSPQWITHYQTMKAQLCAAVSEEQKAAYVREAEIWNTEGAPADVQMARVEKHGEKAVKEFAQYVFKMMGMRVYVLGTYRGKNAKIYTTDFDFNDQLGGGNKVEDKVADWNSEEYLRLFKRYANTQFAPEQEVDGEEEPKKRKRNTEPALELDTTEDGEPLLPSQEVISVASLNQKKQLIAQFVCMHYVKCCGMPEAKVPWGVLQSEQDKYISAVYMPEDITLKDCTKIIQADVDQLLNFWSDQQDDPEVDYTFKFKAWKGRDKEPQPPVKRVPSRPNHLKRAGHKNKGKEKAVTPPHPEDEENTTESDKDGSRHDESSNIENENEPGPSEPHQSGHTQRPRVVGRGRAPLTGDAAAAGPTSVRMAPAGASAVPTAISAAPAVTGAVLAGASSVLAGRGRPIDNPLSQHTQSPSLAHAGGQPVAGHVKDEGSASRTLVPAVPRTKFKSLTMVQDSPEARQTYLLSLFQQMPYRNFIKVIPKLAHIIVSGNRSHQWAWGEWKYTSPHCTRAIHSNMATGFKFAQWLSSKPYYTSKGDNFKLDMVKTQNMALVIGLMLRDLKEAQVANEVEGEPTNLPDYVLNSVLSEDMVENVLLPTCDEMRVGIEAVSEDTEVMGDSSSLTRSASRHPQAQPGKSGGPDVLPVPKNGASPKEGSRKRKKNELEPVEEEDEVESSSRKKGKGVPG
ncbi:hypothetical protein AcV5_003765 [Taiwanofungus camphoratus]|nr:hypothetical protein AcV5_003765 [Antrodia cinnamomea]